MIDLGTVLPGSTIRIPVNTFDSNDPSASVTATTWANTDCHVHKDGGTTQRASSAGETLTIDFDSVTGNHILELDLADNTTANFYEAGSEYHVRIEGVTVDAGNVNAWIGRFRIGYPGAILDTTIATLSSQTSFTLEDGSADNDAYNGFGVIVHDLASAVQIAHGIVSDYVGSTKTVTLKADPGIFTMAAGDSISLFRPVLTATTPGSTIDVTATGAAGIDWANVENPTTAVDLSQTDIQLCDTITTYTGNTVQTGDSFARIGAAGAGLTNINLPNQTMDITGDITGNLSGSVGSVTATVSADVVSVSGDSTAADNLELMYDGTGYTAETAPASRAQVDGIGSGSGGSIPFAAIEDNTGGAIDPSSAAFVGSVTSGTFANVASEDGTSHDMNDSVNDIDIVYGFQVGGGRVGTTVQISANVDGNADEMKVKAYDHVGADWEVVGTIDGSSGTTFKVIEPALFQKYTGTGSELGKVYIRFETDSTTPSQLQVDKCVVLGSNLGQTIGYSNGSVWVNTSLSNTNTESFVDGVADNPVSTIAAAITIAEAVGLQRITFSAGSSVTLAADMSNYELLGENWTLAFGGQTITGANICGATVSGTFVGSTGILENCIINAIAGPGLTMRSCYFNEVTITNNGTAGWYMNDCRSRIAGTGRVTFDFGAAVANTGLSLRAYSGGIELQNMGQSGTDTASCEGWGNLVLNANCVGGTVAKRGIWDFTNNGSGQTIVESELIEELGFVLEDTGTTIPNLIATAQADLDIITGADGVNLLSATQASIDAIETDTSTTLQAELDAIQAAVITNAAGADIAADIIAMKAETALIVADTNELQTNQGNWLTATGFSTHSAANVRTEMDSNSTQLAAIVADTNELQTDWADGGRLDVILDSRMAEASINTTGGAVDVVTLVTTTTTNTDMRGTDSAATAANLATVDANVDVLKLGIVTGTVDTATNSHTPTTTVFQADDITEATADHFIGRIVTFTSGALANQSTDITDYEAVGGIGQFTTTALTEAPANNDTFKIT